MSFQSGLRPGDIIDNQRLVEIFRCSSQGGMRRSHQTNTLVIVSDHTRSIYEDRWVGNTFHYTGMGQRGDQSLEFMQNKTLAESNQNGVEVHLFEVFVPGKYTYMGRVELAGQPYQEIQPDADGNPRRVWVFPLRLVDTSLPVPIPEEFAILKQKQKEKQAKRMDDEILLKRINFAPRRASTRQVSTITYEQNPYVAEYARRRAKGKCQLCKQPAPFNDRDGQPFLEVHHIVWLSRGGEDTINNTVALCPNCHRKMHVLDLAADREKLQKELQLINGRNS
ncbi:HNH endonuclease [Desulfofundulus thermosubterraneus]|uniref:5-methylcytosine-specific restriction enzyme A n=1 Tax=Desulfofundulus thermosubterraneus DSM 16057 TaxID=1121432 RepID=A0A1M6BD70_9FIRM|nr:HNH endonuclease signature motif containing protein [Desulfofundulus thermosubterraneus]SHI46665.1 5-methylcytosine-specific restriction enzyme A [Desulfofundulus thermosubterraneus DSM 16057]